MKIDAFFENGRLLQEEMQIVPLLYGSLGLEYLTKENLGEDDIDILIPEIYLTEQWAAFRTMLERNGYHLIEEHEHTFEKSGTIFPMPGWKNWNLSLELLYRTFRLWKQTAFSFGC